MTSEVVALTWTTYTFNLVRMAQSSTLQYSASGLSSIALARAIIHCCSGAKLGLSCIKGERERVTSEGPDSVSWSRERDYRCVVFTKIRIGSKSQSVMQRILPLFLRSVTKTHCLVSKRPLNLVWLQLGLERTLFSPSLFSALRNVVNPVNSHYWVTFTIGVITVDLILRVAPLRFSLN